MVMSFLILRYGQGLVYLARQPKFRDRPSLRCGRLNSLFGFGWFLEWPEGQHPLNSAWPWSGVKLAIVVLWGVCWMFYMRLNHWQRSESLQRRLQVSTRPPPPAMYNSSSNLISLDPAISANLSATTIKQEPHDSDLFVFGQYQNSNGNQLQRPNQSDWPAFTDNLTGLSKTKITTRVQINRRGDQGESQAVPPTFGANQLSRFPRHASRSMQATPMSKPPSKLVMSNTHRSKSPVPEVATQGSSYYGRLAKSNTNIDANTNKAVKIKSSHNFDSLNPSNVRVDPHILSQRITSITRDVVPAEKSENGLLRHQPHEAEQQTLITEPSGTNFLFHYNNHTHLQHNRNTLESGNYNPFAQYYSNNLNPETTDIYQNYGRTPFTANMSLSYESRAFMSDTQYPMQMAHDTQEPDEFKHDEPRYPSPPPPLSENPYTAQPMTAPEEHPIIEPQMELPEIPKDEEDAPSPGRSKPVPKPDREVTKDANGRYYCAWPGCTEEVRDFNRKCEWSKHMDKHDRPYRCKEVGCEKLPGFTYSGGLLRHEREVHGKHGGPKKQLNCPHPNCKRHTGKGFSRQENLNEHLRRVHTDAGVTQVAVEETEEDPTQAAVAGVKRKRGASKGDSDLREEMKRMKAENEELKRQYDAQQAQCAEMMRQLVELQNLAGMQHPQRMAPQAPM
ncbi:hypothetical protein ACMFMG_005841 [Clarireedia jacksonii]